MPTYPKPAPSSRIRPWAIGLLGAGLVIAAWAVRPDRAAPGRVATTSQPDAEIPAVGEPTREPLPVRQLSGAEFRDRLRADLAALAERDPDAFKRRIEELLRGTSDMRMVALEARLSRPDTDVVGVLATALADATCPSEVRATVLHELERYARVDPRSRRAMLDFLGGPSGDAAARRAAFVCVLRFADRSDVDEGLQLLHAVHDPDIVVDAVRGLSQNTDPAIRQRVNSLHWRHPDPVVRTRLRALRIGN